LVIIFIRFTMLKLLSLSQLESLFNFLEKRVTAKTLFTSFRRLFKWCIILAAIYGGIRGIE
jgi:hypothetical protein